MEHPISVWLRRNGKTQNWLAAQVGICKQYLSQIVLGHARCGGQTAVKLSRAIGGAVSAEDIIVWSPKRARRRGRAAA